MPTTLTARSPDDVLAAVPVLLGFVPSDSVAMLTLRAKRSFHARIDLPREPAPQDLSTLADALLEPVRRHHVRRVMFVIYTEHEGTARAAWRVLRRRFREVRVQVAEALWADGEQWFPLLVEGPETSRGHPYDLSTHAFTAQGVLEGRVVLGSRRELATSVEPAPDLVARVAARVHQRIAAPGDTPPPPLDGEEVTWGLRRVGEAVAGGGSLEEEEWARLLLALPTTGLDDLVWASLTQGAARAHVALWSDAVRRAPPGLVAAPALLLGFAAWLAGDGALGWCAHDRWLEAHRSGSGVADSGRPGGWVRAGLLRRLLLDGAPPSVWDQVTGSDAEAPAITPARVLPPPA